MSTIHPPPKRTQAEPGPPAEFIVANPEDEQPVTVTLRRAELTALLGAGKYVFSHVTIGSLPPEGRVGWLGAAIASVEAQQDEPRPVSLRPRRAESVTRVTDDEEPWDANQIRNAYP